MLIRTDGTTTTTAAAAATTTPNASPVPEKHRKKL
jgi:hypothetical protein